MYRSFSAMWEGWKKNLFQLMGSTTGSVFAEFESAFPWMILVILIIGIKLPFAMFAGVILLLLRQISYGMALSVTISRSNTSFITYRRYLCTRACSGRRTKATPRAKLPGKVGNILWVSAHPTNRNEMLYLTRKLEFSASHLYHNPALSAEENRRVFGKCNNPHGHGHNYTLEVTIAGEPDPVTGMVLDLKELKEILDREITQRMDHRFLNYEVAELKNQIPTCENVARVIWNLLER